MRPVAFSTPMGYFSRVFFTHSKKKDGDLVGSITILRGAVCWQSGLSVDADGAPNAYAPEPLVGLDYLANAGGPGNWYGVACNTSGMPYIQKDTDPYPGYYVSTTAMVDHSFPVFDPKRYVDSTKIPYISIPPELFGRGCHKGDLAWVVYSTKQSAAIVADVGPHGKLGEGSMALAEALGLPSSPRNGGCSFGVQYWVFPGTRAATPWPRDLTELSLTASKMFDTWKAGAP